MAGETLEPPLDTHCGTCRRERVVVAYEVGGSARISASFKDGEIDRLFRTGKRGEPASALFCPRCDATADWPRFAKGTG
jgi:hypothetical protein